MSRAATTMQTTSVAGVVQVVQVVLGWILGQVSLAWRSCSCPRPWVQVQVQVDQQRHSQENEERMVVQGRVAARLEYGSQN